MMWYIGYDGAVWKTGLAISMDKINWTKYDDPATSTAPYSESDPVFQPGSAGSWDDTDVWIVSVIFDGGIYKGWYHGSDDPEDWNGQIGYATSEDGIHWTKYDNPVLDFGLTGTWDDSDLGYVQVILEGENYHMWYTGEHGGNWRTGYATSRDGIYWTKYAGNPVLDIGTSGTWDAIEANVTSVIFQDPVYKMWYWGSGGLWRIGYAEDFSQIARADSISLNLTYARPQADSLLIKTHTINPNNHILTVKAQIVSDNSVFVDSADFTHKGDGLWAGIWPVPAGERNYKVGIKTIDEEKGTVHNGIMWDFDKFTTIGPIVYDDYELRRDTIANPGDELWVRVYLKNNGNSAPATKISATLTSLDTLATVNPLYSSSNFADIGPGESVHTDNSYKVIIADGPFPNNPYELRFALDIKNHGYSVWKATTDEILVGLESDARKMPLEFALHQNYPNPFNPSTTIKFTLPKPEHVTISVYNTLGQVIETPINKPMSIGHHQVEYNAQNLPSGVYFYRLEAGEYIQTRKMLLVK